MKISNLGKLVIAVAISLAAGGLGSIFTSSAIPTWYTTLSRPALNPPNWIFAPVWTTLFVLMGIAAFLIWKRGIDKPKNREALKIFLGQLILNVLWSFIFFGLHNPGLAFLEIIFLWLAILATILSFSKISKTAAYLLIPYIAWVSFASYLNLAIWQLN
jgi:tryptophan-rich sensory protein